MKRIKAPIMAGITYCAIKHHHRLPIQYIFKQSANNNSHEWLGRDWSIIKCDFHWFIAVTAALETKRLPIDNG
jgi:hypothetical protein